MARGAQVEGFGELVSAPSEVRSKPRKRMSVWQRTSQVRFTATLLALLALGVSGCRLAEQTVKSPARVVTSLVPHADSSKSDPAALQTELQRYADEYASRTAAALEDYARLTGTPEARRQALQWKASVGLAAVSIASGPNPQANLMDFLGLATVTRLVMEEVWIKTTNGPAFQPWLTVSRVLETNVWRLVPGVFSPEQQQELREAIRQWWEANPEARAGFFVRPQEFTSLIRQTHQKSERPGSVFRLVGLDPTAGLDPAVREVARTRLLAERALFVAQRMPLLLRWQAEMLADDFLRQEQVATALGSADRLSRAVDSASQTAALLPDRITAERKAILEALEAQDWPALRRPDTGRERAIIWPMQNSTTMKSDREPAGRH